MVTVNPDGKEEPPMHDSLATDATTAADFANAIAAGDRSGLMRMLASNVAFRALTPSRAWELDSAEDAVDTMLGSWFGGERHIDSVQSVETDTIGDLVRVGYRFRATTPTGPAVVEQQAYLALADNTITAVRIVCSGYQPVAD
jgi:hypothetical protein